ncbi:hypothetical protein HDA32_004436 [Spinactinospora alkalitolerans]|uniref:Uncharacterized protein n=1 Tax=Spinactinospora alkalitolerans TaxID=687207 RepID=A0A852TXS0_9ACTN|nr:hypothetical protein [Spinactinospora alkalitolerans]NYE49316.1 hypothetical protein [Spinactinospora alkalitolerans]
MLGRSLLVLLLVAGVVMASSGARAEPGADGRSGGELDGFAIGHVPSGAGDAVSDFDYEWGRVAFSSRVWERRVDGGYRVDLTVAVLRGERLRDLDALREFLAEYHERDPDAWALEPFRHGEHRGHITDGQAFWLVEPGLAVSVRLDAGRFGRGELTRTALGVRRVE